MIMRARKDNSDDARSRTCVVLQKCACPCFKNILAFSRRETGISASNFDFRQVATSVSASRRTASNLGFEFRLQGGDEKGTHFPGSLCPRLHVEVRHGCHCSSLHASAECFLVVQQEGRCRVCGSSIVAGLCHHDETRLCSAEPLCQPTRPFGGCKA